MTSSSSFSMTIKWGKETLTLDGFDASTLTATSLLQAVSDKTNVPVDRIKLMSKTKGLWKGVLSQATASSNAGADFGKIDWTNAIQGATTGIQLLLMGSAADAVLPDKPRTPVVFLEDLPPEQAAAIQEPSGLANLGNTCYLNSVVQCLRAVPPLRAGLSQFAVNSRQAAATSNNASSNNSNANPASKFFVTALQETMQQLDRQAHAYEPGMLVQATRHVFPQFAQRGPHGHPQQQDAEEFYSNLLTVLSSETQGISHIQSALGGASSDQLMGASNLVDALFGLKMEETLTCDEVSDIAAEPAVKSFDLHRKLVCNIQGGGTPAAASGTTVSSANDTNVTHIAQGIQLSLNGTIEKHSEVLGRNAVWTRRQCIARLPPVLAVQFGRFYWKPTPDSQDHAGVKCKVMKPVAFTSTLDVYDFCTQQVKQALKMARDKALAEEEDAINKKLKGEVDGGGDDKKAGDVGDVEMNTSQEMAVDEEEDPDLQAALAMSMEPEQPPVGPGLPANFQGIYELFAIVTHKGRDADGGHYMAWVKAERNGGQAVAKIADTDVENEDWFVFDDDQVSPCKTEDVLKLKGGGDWHMSYMNFYRAKK